jgi:hypothetical protein
LALFREKRDAGEVPLSTATEFNYIKATDAASTVSQPDRIH